MAVAPAASDQPPTFWRAVYLVVASFCSLVAVGYVLSSFQAHQRIHAVKTGDELLSFHRLVRLSQETDGRDTEIDAQRAKMLGVSAELATAEGRFNKIAEEQDALERQQDDLIDKIADEIDKPQFRANKFKLNYLDKRSLIKTELDKAPTKDGASFKAFLTADRSDDFRALEKQRQEANQNQEVIAARAKKLSIEAQKLLADRRSFGGSVLPKDQSRVMDLVDEMRIGALSSQLLRLPEEALIVLVVIFGGVLGSTVFLTYDYVDNTPPRSYSYYTIRILVGALTALLLFIVIKAGVLLAIDPLASGQKTADLNPFFVTFVGVVGGLISTQVVTKIISASDRWFHDASADKPRYVLPEVVKELSVADKQNEFSILAGVSPDVVNRWLHNGELVAAEQQRSVSLFLKKELRDLFSDIPPRMTIEKVVATGAQDSVPAQPPTDPEAGKTGSQPPA